MKLLEEKIRKEGRIYPGDILKVDSFLNHQVDTAFIKQIAAEFGRLFYGSDITKILTVEASGIVIAYATAQYFRDVPLVYAKKGEVASMSKDVYSAPVYSYTHQTQYQINVQKNYLTKEDRVLLLDDFLANGEALSGLVSICKQAGCEIVGCGIVVEKGYQPGGDLLRAQGLRVESLARVKSMTDDGQIEFYED